MENKDLPQSLKEYMDKYYPIVTEQEWNAGDVFHYNYLEYLTQTKNIRYAVEQGYHLCLSEKQTQIDWEAIQKKLNEYLVDLWDNKNIMPDTNILCNWFKENLPTFLVQSPKESEWISEIIKLARQTETGVTFDKHKFSETEILNKINGKVHN